MTRCLMWLLAIAACGDNAPREVTVRIALDAPVAEIDPRFLSVAVDTAQVVGGTFWDPAGTEGEIGEYRVPPYDFRRPKLRALAAELAPALLRIGGTDADNTYYDLGDTPASEPPPKYKWVLTKQMWDGFVDFARDLDYRLLFTLNAGAGPRVANVWQPDNARALVRHAAGRGDPIDVWELGNEINGYVVLHDFDVTPAEYTRDLAAARALIDEEHPGSKLAGPSSAFWPKVGEFIEFVRPALDAGAGVHLDVLTWHYYPQQSRRCPIAVRRAAPDVMLQPAHLDEIHTWASLVRDGLDRNGLDIPIWLGETGNAQCGGEPGVSDAFAGTFWWLDQLGTVARLGQPMVIRQTLSGSNYGLLDDDTLDPNPDYWASLLWRRLMGTRVLAVDAGAAADVRIYAHCARDAAGVTLLAINTSRIEPVRVRAPALDGRATRYRVTAGGLDATVLELEGDPLAADADGKVPALRGAKLGDGPLSFELPPTSWAFVTLDADVPACR